MIRLPPRSTRTDTLFPDTTLFRSGDEADAMLAADGKDFVLHIAFPDRIFALQRGDRRGLRGAAQRFGPGFRKRDVADLALLHQLHQDRKSTRLNSSH